MIKPWMSSEDIKIIEKLLLGYNNVSILEWGSGGSTKFFTNFLNHHKISYSWVSIEYNKKWYEKVSKWDMKNVKIYLFDCKNNNLKQKDTNMDDYINFPLSLKEKFDVIFVDGRKRRRCLINSTKILAQNGVVVLHDAHRKYYHCAFENFKTHKFLSKSLWCGYA